MRFSARYKRRVRVGAASPRAGVIAWLAEADEDRLFISVVAPAELGCGIERETSGRPIGAADAFIAATAEARDLTLITRNISDFERTVRVVVNPWTDV